MKKLFKEVWKSFSKSKIILAGLSFLVFLTSGIITLLADVINAYSNQYNDFKKTSVLQDITMNSNINPTGSEPEGGAYATYATNIWTYEEQRSKVIESIRIDTTKPYIDLHDLNTSYTKNTLVSTQDLSYLLNSNKNNIKIPNNAIDNAIFNPNKNQINELIMYDDLGEIKKTLVSTVTQIYKVEKAGTKFNKVISSSIKDLLVNGKEEFKPLVIDKDGNAFIIDDVFLSINSKNIDEAKKYQSQPESFYFVRNEVVAKWFGFNLSKPAEDDNTNEYYYSFKKYDKLNSLVNGLNDTKITKPSDLSNKTFNNNFDINLNNAIKSPIEIKTSIVLDKKLTLPNEWFVYSQEKYTFERIVYKFKSNLESSWSGIYKEYLEYLKNNKSNEWEKIQQTSYWKKTLSNNLVQHDGKLVKKGTDMVVSLLKEDLKKPLDNGKITSTILDVENMSSSTPTIELANQLNTDQHTLLENNIKNESLKFGYEKIYSQLKKIVNKIGIRENLTVDDATNEGTKLYHFINVGNENEQLNWNGIKIDQQVGKLVNNPLSSQIYSLKKNIDSNSTEIPQKEMPKILDKLLTGLSLNRDYVNPMISFQTFEYIDKSTGAKNKKSNAKIIWLTPEGNNDSKQLIGLTAIRPNNDPKKNKIFYLLEQKNVDTWEATNEFDSYESMSKYVLDQNLKFAPFDYNNKPIEVVNAQRGWLSKNVNYSDLFYVPFQYLLPSSKIIEESNIDKTFKSFSDALILKLTLNVKPLINATNFDLLMRGISTGFIEAGFGTALTPPAAIPTQSIPKLIIYTIKDALKLTNQNFTNSLFVDMISGIKNQMELNSQGDVDKSKKYLKSQFDNLNFIFKTTMGIDISSIIDKVLPAIKDPFLFLNGFINILNAFDLDQVVLDLYKELSDPTRPANQIVSSGDYLPILYLNLKNSNFVKDGIKNILKAMGVSDLIVIATIALFNFKNPAAGYAELMSQINYVNGKVEILNQEDQIELKDVLIKRIGDNSLKSFLKIFISKLIVDKIPNIDNIDIDKPYDPALLLPLELDMDLLWFLKHYVLTEEHGNIFGVQTMNILEDATNGFVQVKDDNNQIVYDLNLSKIALVNEAYLIKNNKSIYSSNTLEQDLQNIDQIDDKYKISISNVEYVITGSNLTVDYMYPVINAENIQVNVENQALVYVNQYGYDRIKRSKINSPTDKYFLLADPKNNKTISQAQTLLNQLSYYWATSGGKIYDDKANTDANPYRKAYLLTESSLENPERSMRITTIDKAILILSNVQFLVTIILAVITALVIVFVVRRYVASRAKVLGILKAQGYSSLKIALSICLFPFIISIIGGTCGYITGHFTQLAFFNLLSIFWTIPITTAAFNWFTLVLSIVVPFVFLSLLTIIVTLWFLRKNPIELMNGSLEINDTKFANIIRNSVSHTSIKNKFSISLSLGSIGKLLALFISALITSTITLFSVTTFNIFDKSVNHTYQNKNYTYLIDLTSPTIEGGDYYDISIEQKSQNKDISANIDNMLYVPLGVAQEGYTYLKDYFEPGYSNIFNQKQKIWDANGNEIEIDANGILEQNDTTTPHIFTKSSIDLTVKAGGKDINVWESLYNSIPESQRASITNTSQNAASWLEWTQEGHLINYLGYQGITRFMNFNDSVRENEYMTLYDPTTKMNIKINDSDIRIPYFNYKKNNINPEKSHFEFCVPSGDKYTDVPLIITGKINENTIRYNYRNFLVNGYKMMFNNQTTSNKLENLQSPMPEYVLDYFIMPRSNMFSITNSQSNDNTYTYINAEKDGSQKIKIYGFGNYPQQIKIVDNNNKNLIDEINNYYKNNSNEPYPIVINEVVKQKYDLKKNDILSLDINNHFLRNQDKLKSILNKENNTRSFKVIIIGIIDTYINEEWITSKEIANKILGLNNNSYNGIISDQEVPLQIVNSLSLYADNGYWSAKESINNSLPSTLSQSEKEENLNIYKQLFYDSQKKDYNDTNDNNSLLANNIRLAYGSNLKNEEVNQKIKSILNTNNLDITNPDEVYKAINKFIEIYSSKSLQASLVNATSNGIEKDFALNISSTINSGMLIIMIISFSISLVILIMISVMIINENERNIAIFGILGYTTKEKIRMFFSIYVPIVIISLLLSILLVWLFIPLFSSSILAVSSIALPLGMSFGKIALSSFAVIVIFSITCIIAWLIQGRIKPIMLLKEV